MKGKNQIFFFLLTWTLCLISLELGMGGSPPLSKYILSIFILYYTKRDCLNFPNKAESSLICELQKSESFQMTLKRKSCESYMCLIFSGCFLASPGAFCQEMLLGLSQVVLLGCVASRRRIRFHWEITCLQLELSQADILARCKAKVRGCEPEET